MEYCLYKGLIRPCMEYCYQIRGGSSSASLTDRVESSLPYKLSQANFQTDLLALHCNFGSFSLIYRKYFGFCSGELAACMPPPLARPCNTRQAAASDDYCVAIGNSRMGRFDNVSFPIQ